MRRLLFLSVLAGILLFPALAYAQDANAVLMTSDGRIVTVEQAVVSIVQRFGIPPEFSAQDRDGYAPYIRAALRRNIIPNPQNLKIGQRITHGLFQEMVRRAQGTQQTYQPQLQPQPPYTQPVPVGNPYASSLPFAMTIPALGIKDLPVIHPADEKTSKGLLKVLNDGVGHLFNYPGQDGKIMIYGHSSGYAWDVSKFTKIFRQVNRLKNGDRVYVTHNGVLHVYAVTGQQTIKPNDTAPFLGRGEELILYTCWPPDSIKERLIVRAVPVERLALR